MTSPTRLSGLREIASDYDAFFIDQFGVLHDGVRPYDGAVAALRVLKAAGKHVLLLSNSGKRAAPNTRRLTSLGFPADGWDAFVSSGEVAWGILRGAAAEADRRSRCLLIARDGDRSAIDGLPIDPVDDAADADTIVIAASEGDTLSEADYSTLLAGAAARHVPAYCTNPDKMMITPDGLCFGAGRIAELYAALGGPVTWIGKPFPEIYAAARAHIPSIAASRILCIGDSIEHDIAGAVAAGLDALFVRGGIHAGVDDAELPELFAKEGAVPRLMIDRLRW